MKTSKTVRKQDDAYSIDNTMNILYTKLDEAINDLENGRVITEDEMWEELDEV